MVFIDRMGFCQPRMYLYKILPI